MRVLDLFSGYGGFSQGFLERGHEVVRYDIDPKFRDTPNTELKDVFDLTSDDIKGYDVILASPDCTYLSHANHTPDKESLAIAMQLARHTNTIIQGADPQYYIIENPRGRMRKILGVPIITTAWGYWGTAYFKPTDLFGKVPSLDWPSRYTTPAPKEHWKNFVKDKFSYLAPRDPSLRALVPYPFSLALCIAIENNAPYQSTLTEHFEPKPVATSATAGIVRTDVSSQDVK